MQPINTVIDNSNSVLEVTPHELSHGNSSDNRMFGFVIFLLSESIIFFSFFAGYIVYKTNSLNWSPTELEVRDPIINTIVLISSSFIIYIAEKFLHKKNLWGFRFFWLLTIAMGSYFLYGQAVEWNSLSFDFSDGVFGGTFYLLTGFHGLHVLTGVLLQLIMLGRSFIPNNYASGEFGVQSTSLFWHFVDVIWIILFVLIYVWQ